MKRELWARRCENIADSVWLNLFMGSNGNAYSCPRRQASGWAQLNIYTNKQYNFDPSQTMVCMHMAVNMEPSMRYFQINTIPWLAAYDPHINEWVCTKRENNGRN